MMPELLNLLLTSGASAKRFLGLPLMNLTLSGVSNVPL
jgi:hypothetical protein